MNDDKIRITPDALIAMIVTEAQDRELARMPSLEEMNEDFQPSEKFQRKMEALVRDTKRKAERKKRLLNVKRCFITLTAAISIFSCTMLPVKAVREAVITTLIEWHDKFVSIIYVNEESPVSTFHITPSYIPSGFSQIESSGESTGRYYGQFQNSEGDWFSLRVLPVENSQVTSLDSEFSSYYSISFDNNQAIWGIMDDDSNTLLWESSTLSTNSELLPLAYSGRAAGAGCSTGNLFESGALAGFLWWISGGIPSLSVQNRKKHLHRSEPYDEADGGIAGELAGRTRLSGKRLCCGRGESKPASADGPAGAGTAGTGIAAVRTTA